MDTNSIIAFATVAYVVVTLALLLEARALRVAATDAAEGSARLYLHCDYESDPLVYLENHGPAVAREVSLSLGFVTAGGAPTPPARRVVNPVMAPRHGARARMTALADDPEAVAALERLVAREIEA